MTRRPGRELEREPHHIYYHLNEAGDVIYVGRTAHPESRPSGSEKRPWIAAESSEVVVSPPMPFEVAAWVEDRMICTLNPKHNRRRGQHLEQDPRIDLMCGATGMSRADARWNLQSGWPVELAAFRTALATAVERAS